MKLVTSETWCALALRSKNVQNLAFSAATFASGWHPRALATDTETGTETEATSERPTIQGSTPQAPVTRAEAETWIETGMTSEQRTIQNSMPQALVTETEVETRTETEVTSECPII